MKYLGCSLLILKNKIALIGYLEALIEWLLIPFFTIISFSLFEVSVFSFDLFIQLAFKTSFFMMAYFSFQRGVLQLEGDLHHSIGSSILLSRITSLVSRIGIGFIETLPFLLILYLLFFSMGIDFESYIVLFLINIVFLFFGFTCSLQWGFYNEKSMNNLNYFGGWVIIYLFWPLKERKLSLSKIFEFHSTSSVYFILALLTLLSTLILIHSLRPRKSQVYSR